MASGNHLVDLVDGDFHSGMLCPESNKIIQEILKEREIKMEKYEIAIGEKIVIEGKIEEITESEAGKKIKIFFEKGENFFNRIVVPVEKEI